MGYHVFQSGVTGPRGNIGAGDEYHIDSKYSTNLGWEDIVSRFDAKASKYKEGGRHIEFSNPGVAGRRYDSSAPLEQRIQTLKDAAGAHAPRAGFHSFDYYAPNIGTDRWDKSAEGAPIYGTAREGSKRFPGVGGSYGYHNVVEDASGNIVSKVGHGDDRSPGSMDSQVFGRLGDTTIGSLPATGLTAEVPGNTPTVVTPQSDAAAQSLLQNYTQTIKSGTNTAYDKVKEPEPAFDIRNRDVEARGAFDPRFDKR